MRRIVKEGLSWPTRLLPSNTCARARSGRCATSQSEPMLAAPSALRLTRSTTPSTRRNGPAPTPRSSGPSALSTARPNEASSMPIRQLGESRDCCASTIRREVPTWRGDHARDRPSRRSRPDLSWRTVRSVRTLEWCACAAHARIVRVRYASPNSARALRPLGMSR